MIALGETLYPQVAYGLSLMYIRKPINRAMQTVLSTAAIISGTHDPVQLNRSFFLGESDDFGSSGCNCDSEDLPSAKILCIACFAIGEESLVQVYTGDSSKPVRRKRSRDSRFYSQKAQKSENINLSSPVFMFSCPLNLSGSTVSLAAPIPWQKRKGFATCIALVLLFLLVARRTEMRGMRPT